MKKKIFIKRIAIYFWIHLLTFPISVYYNPTNKLESYLMYEMARLSSKKEYKNILIGIFVIIEGVS